MPSHLKVALLVVIAAFTFSATAYAQGSIAGAVRDTSGAVLPGVTVEAASPALIEGTRSATTDGAGQYRIIDLRPGTYTVTFSLPGFNTVRRDGVELTGSFAATINIEMGVGALQETVTVTGENPVVDVQSAQSEQRMDSEILASIPTGRQYYNLTILVPGLATSGSDVGGSSGPQYNTFRTQGGSSDEGFTYINGFPNAFAGLGVTFYLMDFSTAEEITFSVGGGTGEARVGGPIVNLIPKQGGNTVRGSIYANGANGGMEGTNFNQSHRDAGLRAPNQLNKIWDVSANLGGALVRDRLWYFGNFRHLGTRKTLAGVWANLNAGDPTKWTYEPDFSRQATDTGTWRNGAIRLTGQATPRNKVSVFWDEQEMCRLCLGGEGTATQSPEATPTNRAFPERHVQAAWTSPFTNRWLLEGGVSLNYVQHGGIPKEEDTRDLIRVTEQGGLIPGLIYRSANWTRPVGRTWTARGSAAYVTGSHSIKAGLEGNWELHRNFSHSNRQQVAYQFNNGVPNQLTMSLSPDFEPVAYAEHQAAFLQDQWTRGRLTLQGGLRYEHLSSSYSEQHVGATRFLPQALVFPAQDSPYNLHDLAPRMAVVYDLFGTGRTAVKASVGRYVADVAGGWFYGVHINPLNRVPRTTNRAWTDTNRDYVADCDLMNPVANGECGPWSEASFGRQAFNLNFDPDLTTGWNKRFQQWDVTAALRQQLGPRVGLEVEYLRHVYGNFRTIDNLAVGLNDFDTFSVVAPRDPRLPGGGGYTVSGLYDVKPDKFGLVDNLFTLTDKYGELIRHYDGVTVSVNARNVFGMTLQGGVNTGRTLENSCDVRANLPEFTFHGPQGAVAGVGLLNSWCDVRSPWQTTLQGLASYTIPRIDVQVAGTWVSRAVSAARGSQTLVPNESLAANLVYSTTDIASSLGRNLSGGVRNATINIVRPGDLYGDRLNNLDFRVARVQRFGDRRLMVGVDIFNVINTDAVTGYNQTYGPRWLLPTAIMQARFAKISAQFDF